MKHIEFELEDIPQINEIFGYRGNLRIATDITKNGAEEYKEGNTHCYFKSYITDEEACADTSYNEIKEVLMQRGITLQFLFSLEEAYLHDLSNKHKRISE